jgi:hypothetical protein
MPRIIGGVAIDIGWTSRLQAASERKQASSIVDDANSRKDRYEGAVGDTVMAGVGSPSTPVPSQPKALMPTSVGMTMRHGWWADLTAGWSVRAE